MAQKAGKISKKEIDPSLMEVDAESGAIDHDDSSDESMNNSETDFFISSDDDDYDYEDTLMYDRGDVNGSDDDSSSSSDDDDDDNDIAGGERINDHEIEHSDAEDVDDKNDPFFADEFDEEDSGIDENLDGEDYRTQLKGAANFKIKSRRKAFMKYAKSSKATDPELRLYLSVANEAFVKNDIATSKELYHKVLKIDNTNSSALRILGGIALEENDYMNALRFKLRAASLAKSDEGLWKEVAKLALNLGLESLTIKAYSRIIALKGKHRYLYIFRRAQLYKKNKIYGRALDGFRKLFQRFPLNSEYLKEVASVYVEQKRASDAINLYLDILDKNMNLAKENKRSKKARERAKVPVFDWSSLNILCELYINRHEWKPALKVIKIASRFFQGRTDESKIWDETDNDAEFDSRRLDILSNHKRATPQMMDREYEFPFIDIPFKLGLVRLELGQTEEAFRHLNLLLKEDGPIYDLLFEAGRALENNGYYEEALPYLIKATEDEDLVQNLDLMGSIAKCYYELGNYSASKDLYEEILMESPHDNNIKLSLAEAYYYSNEPEKCKKLLEEVSLTTKKVVRLTDDIVDDNGHLVIAGKLVKEPSKKHLTDEQVEEANEKAKRKVLDTFKRMNRLEDIISKGDELAIDTWMQLASQMIEIFTSVPSFFPRDKNRTFKGIVLYRRKKPLEIDERLARVYNLYEGMSNDETNSRLFLTSEKEFRGIDYDGWFMVFVQYALFLKSKDNIEYASQIIDIAMDVSVFIQDKLKESMLKLVRIIFGIHAGEYLTTVLNYVRSFLLNNQFSPFMYKFFLCCFPSGSDAWETFSNYNHQKFFLRQIKAYDSVKVNDVVVGMANITADLGNVKFDKEPTELLYIYANLLGGSRTHISSIVYLNRIYKQCNKDPMVCFALGISHVQRSMQRLSSNRHLQLLQGMSYLIEYRELRLQDATKYEEQEVEYNMGRVFHVLGLLTEAVAHYNKALTFHDVLGDDVDYDLLMDAAYNLALIYNINGNSQMARELTEKYLTI